MDVRDDDDCDEFVGISSPPYPRIFLCFQRTRVILVMTMMMLLVILVGDDNDNEELGEKGQHRRAGLGQRVETYSITRLDTLFIEVSLGNILTPRIQHTKPG